MAKRVLVIGAGPTGLALAAVLARLSVSSLVLQARDGPTPCGESRAIAWMPKGLEFLRQHGLEKSALACGVRRTRHAFEARGRTLLDLSFESLEERLPFNPPDASARGRAAP